MLPRTGTELPPWRRHVATVLLALGRAVTAGFVVRAGVEALLLQPGIVADLAGPSLRWVVLALLLGGAALYVWPRSCLPGFAVLVAGLAAFEWLCARVGLPVGGLFVWSVALLAVLAAGEWLVRRLQRRLYGARAGAAV